MRKSRIIVLVALLVLLCPLFLQVVPALAQTPPGPLDHVQITPASATVPVGGSQQFSAQGYDASNVAINGLNYTWVVIAGGGTINGTGLFTAGNVTGTYTNTVEVIVVQGGVTKLATASVTVTAIAGPLDHVQITPSSATVTVGGSQQFSAQGYDANNVAIPGLTYTWTVLAGGGTINGTGLFTAGNVTGTYTNTIQAVAVQNGIVRYGLASVTVTAGGTPQPPHITKPGIETLLQWVHASLTGISFENFLGAQWTVRDDANNIYAVKALPGVVKAVSSTSLTMLPNGASQTSTFSLTSATVVSPEKTQLKVEDRVVVVTVNDQVSLVVMVSRPTPTISMPPGQAKKGFFGRFVGHFIPPGWSKGKKVGWGKDREDD